MTPDLFVRKVCHDLRAPLRALKELPDWLEEDLEKVPGGVPENVRDMLEMMKTQSTRLDGIVTGLSELAHIRRGAGAPVTDMAALIATDPWAGRVERLVEVDRVPMEEAHVRLVVGHLIENAFKHGEAETHGARLTVKGGGGLITIAVTDAGPGIESRFHDKVYEPLSTLKSRDECEGSGMGLAVVAKIAELYGGSCRIEANPCGRGITSGLSVPVV